MSIAGVSIPWERLSCIRTINVIRALAGLDAIKNQFENSPPLDAYLAQMQGRSREQITKMRQVEGRGALRT